MGRITVLSALGEPLRAEIDVPEISAEELSSLRVVVATPEAFRAAGLEYNPALSGIQITLQRRADGRHFLHLTSPRAVNDPFVDLILETNWSSGRIVRDYTMLLDPPALRQPAAPLAAQVSPVAPASRAPSAPLSRVSPAPAPSAAAAPTGKPPRSAAAPRQAASPKTPSGDGKQVTVQAGDTAGKIAAANKPASVSLDQMLVAILRANPDAFIGGNVNRLKAGVVLDVPTAEQVELVPTGDASQTIVAQSRDFNEFRRRLAEGLPTTQVAPADRQATGKVQAQVQEKNAGPATPDKLTLSKGAVQGKAEADKIARDRAARDAATRVAELNKNIAELNKLGTATPAATGAASTPKPGVAVPVGAAGPTKPASAVSPAVAAPVVKAPAPVVAAAPAPVPAPPPVVAPPPPAPAPPPPAPAPVVAAPVVAAPAPLAATSVPSVTAAPALSASASSPAAAASAPAVMAPLAPKTASAASRPKAPPPPVETSLVDDLLENPIVPATIGGILALLLGFGFYRAQQRKKSTQVDSSFLESRLQPDSFFGASGGQRIDTNEVSQTGSSMVYSPSQLDAAGDVDPVAEADVYLAYGRDLQAEEILKEAMRTTPQRVAVHAKLLEIYAKRRDAKAFELVATEAYGLTHGAGPEWEHICELGQELDAGNPLYRPGGQPSQGTVAMAAASAATGAFGMATATQVMPIQAAPPAAPDLDLDLDFSLGDDPPAPPHLPVAVAAVSPTALQPTVAMTVVPVAQPMPSLDMDFGAATVTLPPPAAPVAARLDAPDLNLTEGSLSFTTEPLKVPPTAPVVAIPASAPAAADHGMIEFDLGALSLDLGGSAAGTASAKAEHDTDGAPLSTAGAPLVSSGFEESGGDPLATKLALAQEFNAIGDPDGARSLAQEVVAEASGDLKNKAQRFLAEIG
ncbi:MAG: FimV/HubP family polar landmark protein [Ramlibacter sp.]